MPPFTVSGQKDNEPERYNETVGSATLADSFKERGGYLRGGMSINGVEFRNFEANSPMGVASLINSKQAQTGVLAEIEDGHLKLSHNSPAVIRIAGGPGYQQANKPGERPEPAAENTLLDDLGLDETTEENEAYAQQSAPNGAVAQFGDGQVATPGVRASQGPFQTKEEIEQANRAMMTNPRGPNPMGGRAPHAPHETVPGTTTTGDQPKTEPADSNAERVQQQPQTPEQQEAANKERDKQANRQPAQTGQQASSESDADREAREKREAEEKQKQIERDAEEKRRREQQQANPGGGNPPAA